MNVTTTSSDPFARPFGNLLRVAYVAGPALMLIGALTFAFGVGLVPPGITSWVEGIICAYGIVMFIPIYLDLSRRLRATHRRLATVTLVTGLFGATCGFSMELARVFEHALRQHGAGDALWASFYTNPGWEYLSVALTGPLFPLTSVLLGVGFLLAKTLPRWVALSLVAAGVSFPLAQVAGLDWALAVTYPGACLLWLVSLSWIALGGRGAPRGVAQSATAPA